MSYCRVMVPDDHRSEATESFFAVFYNQYTETNLHTLRFEYFERSLVNRRVRWKNITSKTLIGTKLLNCVH